MKISSFYKNNIHQNEIFIDNINKEIDEMYYEKGISAENIGRLIAFLRHKFIDYFSKIYGKKINFYFILPKNGAIIEKDIIIKPNSINVYLSVENIEEILDGSNKLYIDYIASLVDQINSEIKFVNNDFNNYLVIQMNILTEICIGELSVYTKQFIVNNLSKPDSWNKFAKRSAIFNDYYNFYIENKKENKQVFLSFLKLLLSYYQKDIDNGEK